VLPHQYDFNDFKFDYKGAPGQALLTETRNFFEQRYKRNFRLVCIQQPIAAPDTSRTTQPISTQQPPTAWDKI